MSIGEMGIVPHVNECQVKFLTRAVFVSIHCLLPTHGGASIPAASGAWVDACPVGVG